MTDTGAQAERGVVIMAYGRRLYLKQANDLAQSLRLHGTRLPLALITEWPRQAPRGLFDLVVPFRGPSRRDCRPKLDFDLYSPFRRTLYLDSDGLAVRDVEFFFDRFAGQDFVVLGSNLASGRWYGDIATMCRRAGASSIPKFSGGFLYFTSTPVVRSVFAYARELAGQYVELALDTFNSGVSDEPLLSMALARHGIAALPSMPDASHSFLNSTGQPDVDVVAGRASFTKNGRMVQPAIVHFAADYSSSWRAAGSLYRRERRRVRVASRAFNRRTSAAPRFGYR